MALRTPIEFYRINEYAVAGTPLQTHFVERDGRSVIFSLVFLSDFSKVPEFCLSTMSGRVITEKGIPMESALAESDHRNRNDLALEKRGIRQFEWLRIAMTFSGGYVDMCFRMQEGIVSGADRYNFPLEMSSSLFLVIKSEEFCSSTDGSRFAILLQRDFIAFNNALKAGQKIIIDGESKNPEEVTSCFVIRPTPLLNSCICPRQRLEQAETCEKTFQPPLCFLCMEKEVEVVTLNCNHVMFCFNCYVHYVQRERERIAAIFPPNKRAEEDGYVRCALCRRRIESIGRIWFKSPNCLLCGCTTIDAVAGGRNGCGCAIGCYKESKKLLTKNSSRCPYCDAKIVELIRIFVQGDAFGQ